MPARPAHPARSRDQRAGQRRQHRRDLPGGRHARCGGGRRDRGLDDPAGRGRADGSPGRSQRWPPGRRGGVGHFPLARRRRRPVRSGRAPGQWSTGATRSCVGSPACPPEVPDGRRAAADGGAAPSAPSACPSPSRATSRPPSSSCSTSWPTAAPRPAAHRRPAGRRPAERPADVPGRRLDRAGQQPRPRDDAGERRAAGGPDLADWCAIDLVVDGRLHRLAVAHVDPAKVQLARDLAERYPADPDAPPGRGT